MSHLLGAEQEAIQVAAHVHARAAERRRSRRRGRRCRRRVRSGSSDVAALREVRDRQPVGAHDRPGRWAPPRRAAPAAASICRSRSAPAGRARVPGPMQQVDLREDRRGRRSACRRPRASISRVAAGAPLAWKSSVGGALAVARAQLGHLVGQRARALRCAPAAWWCAPRRRGAATRSRGAGCCAGPSRAAPARASSRPCARRRWRSRRRRQQAAGVAAVELEDPRRHPLQEEPIVGDRDGREAAAAPAAARATRCSRRRGGWSARRAAADRAAAPARAPAPRRLRQPPDSEATGVVGVIPGRVAAPDSASLRPSPSRRRAPRSQSPVGRRRFAITGSRRWRSAANRGTCSSRPTRRPRRRDTVPDRSARRRPCRPGCAAASTCRRRSGR